MGKKVAAGSHPDDGRSATYWRRRVVVLSAGIALVSLFAWAVNGTLGGPSGSGRALAAGTTATAGSGKGHSGSGAPAGGGTVSPRPSGSATAGDGAPSSPQPTRSTATKAPAAAHSPAAASRAGHPATCAASDVVLSITSPKYWYKAGETPKFTVFAVSTATRACSFNIGTSFVSVVVESGTTRMWSSADCPAKPLSQVVVLERGVPAVAHASWNRTTSAPGCKGVRHQVTPGTYTARAVSGHLHSTTRIFVLGGAGVAVP